MAELHYDFLQPGLDRAKSTIFLNKNAAFLAPLMCSMNFLWDENVKLAQTDGVSVWFNPHWFLSIPKDRRGTELLHELWHPARAHFLRQGNRDPKKWNDACDYVINNDMDDMGYKFDDAYPPLIDHAYRGLSEEDIYEILNKQPKSNQKPNRWGPAGEMKPATPQKIAQAMGNLIKAQQAAIMAGQPGTVPGSVQQLIKDFLKPKVPWQGALYQWFTDLGDWDYTWSMPDRRSQDIYLPSLFEDEGRLDVINYYIDVSGSVNDKQVVQMNSEIKFIKETFNPRKLTVILFDTEIKKEIVFTEDDYFDQIVIVGRGGTDFRPVRKHIMDTKPTAAIIFSDMLVHPMDPGPTCPIIWIAVDSPVNSVPFGKLIKIRS